MSIALWPRSLAARTALVLVAGLFLVQGAALSLHAWDRIDLLRLEQARGLAFRVMGAYRTVVAVPPADRERVLATFPHPPGVVMHLADAPAVRLPPAPFWVQRLLRVNLALTPLPPRLRPRRIVIRGGLIPGRVAVGLRLPDEAKWLDVTTPVPPLRPWRSPGFLWAFALMMAVALGLSLWAVRRLTAPLRTLADAADALGRDVNAPPLPEDGPTEIATAARAFNTMAGRIRRFVQDRTELLAAIGHDLRTPITRLKLRAEFIEDEDQSRKFLADLDELEAMVAATLAFARDARDGEPVVSLDLAELLRTVLDEAADARPEAAEAITYSGPAHLTFRGRTLALKRAFANLAGNALAYGGSARVSLHPPDAAGFVTVEIEDDGPGIPPAELEAVFEPFRRGEPSRNKETGGVGLGLPIVRNILRAHGGDVGLANRTPHGLRATVRLPG
jgi:signal transduction histidine kinase